MDGRWGVRSFWGPHEMDYCEETSISEDVVFSDLRHSVQLLLLLSAADHVLDGDVRRFLLMVDLLDLLALRAGGWSVDLL